MKKMLSLIKLTLMATLLLLGGCASVQTHQPALPLSPQHIALLLPLSGPLSPYATAIRNGFFTAYYEQKNRTGTAPSISVMDTTGQPIQTVYKTAVAQGADFIVGPLDKTNVTALVNTQVLPVPVLA